MSDLKPWERAAEEFRRECGSKPGIDVDKYLAALAALIERACREVEAEAYERAAKEVERISKGRVLDEHLVFTADAVDAIRELAKGKGR